MKEQPETAAPPSVGIGTLARGSVQETEAAAAAESNSSNGLSSRSNDISSSSSDCSPLCQDMCCSEETIFSQNPQIKYLEDALLPSLKEAIQNLKSYTMNPKL